MKTLTTGKLIFRGIYCSFGDLGRNILYQYNTVFYIGGLKVQFKIKKIKAVLPVVAPPLLPPGIFGEIKGLAQVEEECLGNSSWGTTVFQLGRGVRSTG